MLCCNAFAGSGPEPGPEDGVVRHPYRPPKVCLLPGFRGYYNLPKWLILFGWGSCMLAWIQPFDAEEKHLLPDSIRTRDFPSTVYPGHRACERTLRDPGEPRHGRRQVPAPRRSRPSHVHHHGRSRLLDLHRIRGIPIVTAAHLIGPATAARWDRAGRPGNTCRERCAAGRAGRRCVLLLVRRRRRRRAWGRAVAVAAAG